MLRWVGKKYMEMQKVREENRKNGEMGFTLIELLVVVIIIGILAAIAIPTFLSQRDNARNSAAVADLRNGVTAMESYGASDNPAYSFTSATPAVLNNLEPSITWDAAGTAAGNVGITSAADAVAGASRGIYTLQVTSASGAIYTGAADGNGQIAYTVDEDGAGGTAAVPFTP